VGRRWFSAEAGLVAATLMAVAPTAVLWGGRARMYALLQLLVLLTLYCALLAQPVWRLRVSISPPGPVQLPGRYSDPVRLHSADSAASAGTVVVGWIQARQTGERPWFRSRRVWWEICGLAVIVLVAFLVKRLASQKHRSLQLAGRILTGIAQVVAIYGAFPPIWRRVGTRWPPSSPRPRRWYQPFWLYWPSLGVASTCVRRRASARDLATLFLALILAATTLEMIFFVASDRRDDKYLVMLLPVLFLLAADGATRLTKFQISPGQDRRVISNLPRPARRSRGG